MILGRMEILAHHPPLVRGIVESQIQPNGVDLTVDMISSIDGPGTLDFDNSKREIPHATELEWVDGCLFLQPGCYKVTFAEPLDLPLDVCAIAQPRSSLLRMGIAVHTGVADVGYHGRCESLLVVYNPAGVRIYRGAKVVQLVLMRMEKPAEEGYSGRYQGENL